MQIIGHIRRERYCGVSAEIRSTAVVLTDRQRMHIIKRRGLEFYSKYGGFFREIVEDPDYIFRDRAHENTAIASKTIALDGKHIHLVIRLAVVGDDAALENSIITAVAESDKRYRQRLRNNLPLYKRE